MVEPVRRPLGAPGIDKTALYIYIGAQCLKALDMQVDGTNAQITAAGHGDLCFTEPAQQCANQIVGGAHAAGELVGNAAATNAATVNLKRVFIDGAHIGAQFL